MHTPGAICVTGANGLLGGLCVAALVRETDRRLVLLHRRHHSREDVLAPIAAELAAQGTPLTERDSARIACLPLPENHGISDLAPLMRELRVDEVVHAAGCVDYFDSSALQQGNQELTAALLHLARTLAVRRFVFISTAFSGGYRDERAREALHDEPREDPTDYVKSKRESERLVATSGLPFLVLRPSIVIGDSRDGRYAGKTYGIYQLWAACDRLFSDRYTPTFHALAPRSPVHLLHQDAFQAAFAAAFVNQPDDTFLNLVSREATLPTMRDAWEIFARGWAGPQELYCYDTVEEIPKGLQDRRQALLATFSAVNLDIASHRWRFETAHLERLRLQGLRFADATVESLAVCQRRFMRDTPRVQQYLARFGGQRSAAPRIVDASASLRSAG